MGPEVSTGLMMKSDHVAVFMERTVEIAMSGAMCWPQLIERIVTVDMLSVAPGTVNEEQAAVDDAPAEDGVFSFVHLVSFYLVQ
jgi:hypothetical protein